MSVAFYRGITTVSYGRVQGTTPRGAPRGVVDGMSDSSRRRLLRTLLMAPKLPELFVTLTYPREFPTVAEAKEQHRRFLACWVRRLAGSGVRLAVVWRLELQRRGAAHFHSLWWISPYPVPWERVAPKRGPEAERAREFLRSRQWPALGTDDGAGGWRHCVAVLSGSWYHYSRSEDEASLHRAVDVQEVRGDGEEALYIAKYCAKQGGRKHVNEETGEVTTTGRFWGKLGAIEDIAPQAVAWYTTLDIREGESGIRSLWRKAGVDYAIEQEARDRRAYSVLSDGRRLAALAETELAGWQRRGARGEALDATAATP